MVTVTSQAGAATCRILTFKDGLLSAVAHDLEIDLSVFTLSWDGPKEAVEASFDTRSARVLWAVRRGVPDAAALTEADRAKIETTLREEILQVARFPEARFAGAARRSGDGYQLEGELQLRGTRRPLSARVSQDARGFQCEVELDQRTFGITPFRAALGTLRVKPTVRVKLSVPSPTPPA